MNQNNFITFLRFPLIVGVLAVHTHLTLNDHEVWYDYYSHIIGKLTLIAPAIFFMMSAYLFFYKGFSTSIYKYKLKKRIKTLLIPYLIWNLLYLLFIWAIQTIAPSLIGNGRKMVADYSIWELLNSFWNFGGMYNGMPILYAFWFIRDLLVINLFAPIVYYLIKQMDILIILVLVCFFIINPLRLCATDLDWVKAILFYFIGAYFAIKQRLLFDLGKLYWVVLPTAFLLLIIPQITNSFQYGGRTLFVVLAVAVPAALQKYTSSCHMTPSLTLAQSSFFVYAFHLFVIEGVSKLWQLLLPNTSLVIAIGRIAVPLSVGFFCVGLYCLLNRLMPKLISIVTGGR